MNDGGSAVAIPPEMAGGDDGESEITTVGETVGIDCGMADSSAYGVAPPCCLLPSRG